MGKEDVRRVEHEESAGHKAGNIPAGSDAAAMQSMMDKQNQNKGEVIEEREGNLPLPEQPPTKSDFNSADASTVNVGSGGVSDTFSKDKAGLADTTNKDYGYPQKNDPTS